MRSFPFLLLAGFALTLMTTLPVSADTGYKIGLQTGSMSEAYAAENLTNAEVMGYDTLYNASEALKQGEVEFVLGNHTLLKNYENENLTVVDTFNYEEFDIGVLASVDSPLIAGVDDLNKSKTIPRMAHTPTEVEEGDQFTAWIYAEENVTSVTFFVCTLEVPYTCYKPETLESNDTANGLFEFTYVAKPDDYPGYRYVLEKDDNSTEKIPKDEYGDYDGMIVANIFDSYYFKVKVKGEEIENPNTNETVELKPPNAVAGDNITVDSGDSVQFNGTGTDEDGTIVKYEWDFDGDGIFEWSSTENGRELNIYNSAGTYTATLRVTDNDGNTALDSLAITVEEVKEEIEEETIEEDEETLAGQCTCPDGSKGQMVGPADDDGVDDGCLCATSEDDSSLPSVSMIPALILIGIIALRRRY